MESDNLKKVHKPPYSRSAIASLVFGLLFITGAGLLGLVFGGIGLWSTRRNLTRGRSMARWGFGLGLLSLFLNLYGCPGVILPPPLEQRDFAFSKFLTDLAATGQADIHGKIRLGNIAASKAQETRWRAAFNRDVGNGHLVWLAGKTMFGDSVRVYIVYFEKAGFRMVNMYADDTSGWIVFLPFNLPQPNDPRFSDDYVNNPEYREMVDQSFERK